MEQLRQLVELFESGALTEAEFAAAKQRLLGIDEGDSGRGAEPRPLGDSTPDAPCPPGEVGADSPTGDGSSVSDNPTGGPAAGWYSDPWGDHDKRYWDGEQWTGEVSDDGTHSNGGPHDTVPPPAGEHAAANDFHSRRLHANSGLSHEELQRLNQYKSHQDSLCLECGYRGTMGVADKGKSSTLIFRWPGFVFVVILVAIFAGHSLLVGAIVGGLWAVGHTMTLVPTLHCPACDQLISARK